jgi:hypothetical protein
MARTKMEVDALTEAIWNKVLESRAKVRETLKPKAQKLYNSKYKKLIKELDKLSAKMIKVTKQINNEIHEEGNASRGSLYKTWNSENDLVDKLVKKLAKAKPITKEDITREVILSQDTGSDLIIKNISKMFL